MAHVKPVETRTRGLPPPPGRCPKRREAGSSLVEVLAAIAITAAVMVAATGIFQRAGSAITLSLAHNRQVKALNHGASEARRSGTGPSQIEGYQISYASRTASWGTDAVLTFRVPNSSCQGDCDPDPAGAVNASSVVTVTAEAARSDERPVSLTVFRAAQ